MKHSKKFNRDYEFYLKNKDTFTFSGDRVDVVVDLENGVDAKRSFRSFDTSGKLLPTNEPDLLKSIIVCKKSINLHIKLWVEGFDEMMEGVDYYMDQFIGDPPPWVEDSFTKQLQRRCMKQRR